MTKVLLMSNDSSLSNFVNVTLRYNGFTVHTAANAAAGWKFLKEVRFDFIIVDTELRDQPGLGFYKSLREFGASIPVLMVGECAFDEFMLQELPSDNYDYLLKPFKFETLKAKMNHLLQMNLESERIISYGPLRVDVRQQIVVVKDKIVQLGKKEMKIMVLLARMAGGVVDLSNTATLNSITKLRKKIKKVAGKTFDISQIQNQGFKLVLNG